MTWERDGLRVDWCAGGLYLEHAGIGLLLDAPVGAAIRLGHRLGRIQGIVLSSGRASAVGGLVPLLCALERHRGPDWAPLPIHVPLDDERGALLTGAWSQGWPDRYPVSIDAEMPGAVFELAGFKLRTVSVRRGEPAFGRDEVHAASGLAVRVQGGEAVVAWVPGASPGNEVRRACQGVDLAIVEVGVEPWPDPGTRWRLTLDEALQAAQGAREVWLVGDDGRRVEGTEN